MRIWIRNIAFFLENLRICDLRTGTPQKCADFRLLNVPKNLRICDLRANKKNLRAHLCIQYYCIYQGRLTEWPDWIQYITYLSHLATVFNREEDVV
jgi:hypothetical protein